MKKVITYRLCIFFGLGKTWVIRIWPEGWQAGLLFDEIGSISDNDRSSFARNYILSGLRGMCTK